jgi:hypothetical protein
MKGWITVDPNKVIEVVNRYGRLKVLDDRELVIEIEKTEDFQKLQKALQEAFGQEVEAELIVKKKRGDYQGVGGMIQAVPSTTTSPF